MKKNLIFRSFVLAAAASLYAATAISQTPAPAANIKGKVDEYMKARLDVRGYGGTVLIMKDGTPIISAGYGLADEAAKQPNAPDTKFRIASVTKQFTAALVLLLQEDGKLNIQDPICKYIDPCGNAWQPVTIHNLLSMTSGIPSFTGLPNWGEHRIKDMRPFESVALVIDQPLKTKPGEAFEYSNTNYILLGMLIEKLSGKSYEAFLAERITKPLKMTNTGYDHGKDRLPNSALGYTRRNGDIARADAASMMIPWSAGGLYSTTGDLFTWQDALLNGRVFKKKETLEAMLTPVKDDYAYGIAVMTDPNGRKRITHNGGIEGFSSDAVYFPEEKVFMTALVNNDRGNASDVLGTLTAIYFGEPYAVPKKRVAVKVNAAILDTYVGEYRLGPNFSFKITREGDGLAVEPTGQAKRPLFAESETEFFLTVVDAQMKFLMDESGKVTAIDFTQNGRTSKALRQP